jgi:hypothetical protein
VHVSRRAAWLRVSALAAVLVGASCTPAPDGRVRESDALVIDRWLTCEECVARERDRVIALGGRAIAPLERALAGPPDSVIRNIERSSGASFARARRQAERGARAGQGTLPLGDSAALVRLHVGNFRSLYQMRAAETLRQVDPSQARVRFRRALVADSVAQGALFRADVRRYVDSLARAP